MCPCRLIISNKHITCWGISVVGETLGRGQGSMRNLCTLCVIQPCILNALKNKGCLKKNKEVRKKRSNIKQNRKLKPDRIFTIISHQKIQPRLNAMLLWTWHFHCDFGFHPPNRAASLCLIVFIFPPAGMFNSPLTTEMAP